MVKSLFKFLRNSLVNPFNLRNGRKFLFPVVFHSKAVERYFLEKPPRRNTRVDYLALSKGEWRALKICLSSIFYKKVLKCY